MVDVFVELGSGQSAVVYAATFKGDRVAVKEMKDFPNSDQKQLKKEFEHQANVLRRLHHDNIVKVRNYRIISDIQQFIACCTEEQPMILVTELVAKGSLYKLLHPLAKNTVPAELEWERKGASIALGCAFALEYLHSVGIIHRDFRSPNVLVPKQTTILTR